MTSRGLANHIKLKDGARLLQRIIKSVSFILFPECSSLVAEKAWEVSLLYDKKKFLPKCGYIIRSAVSSDIDGFINGQSVERCYSCLRNTWLYLL